jgi:FkbM family methyltransferase
VRSLYNVIRFILSHPLASKNKTEAFKRFFYYQIRKLFNPNPIIYPFTEKTKLMVEKGMTGATGNIYCGLHEFEDMGFLLHFLRPEDLFVDVGANVGTYTVLASGQVGCETIAFEPLPSTFRKLENNVVLNRIENKVSAHNVGVGSKKGTLKFTTDFDTVNHVVTDTEQVSVTDVSVVPLDEILVNRVPLLMKIDVEGFEKEVLDGASNVLNNPKLKAIIIELNGSGKRYGYSDEAIHLSLINRHFKAYRYQPYLRELIELQTFGNTNTIYVKDLTFVTERIRSAEKVLVVGVSF